MNKLLALTSVLLIAGATAAPVVAQQYDPAYGYGQSRYDNGDSGYRDSGYGDSSYRDDGDARDGYDDRDGNGYYDSTSYQARGYDNGQGYDQGYRDGNQGNDYQGYGDTRYQGHRHSDRRHDRRHYAQQRYRASRGYAYPRGYQGGSWNVGSRLPSGYYPRGNYVDYRSYRLNAPARGYQWVRVENDVYMVSPASGLIRDVMYGLFY
jgi:Ni/Co efflux regulator RcnB